jgi:hypothetical protein
MTAAEQAALKLIYDAGISLDTWVSRIQHGYRGKPYNYKATAYYKALKILRDAGAGGNPTPTPPPPAPLIAKLAQKVVYCAQNPLTVLGASSDHIPALTADPGYASFNTPDVVIHLRSKFPRIAGWGVQTQIGAQAIHDFVDRLGLDYAIFQGETSDEYRTAIDAGAKVIVGNANAWTDAQRQDATVRVNQGHLAFAQEAYTNLGGPWPESTSSGGVPAASLVIGVYDGTAEVPGAGWNPSVAEYKAHTPPGVWQTISVYHAAGVNPAEWQLLA